MKALRIIKCDDPYKWYASLVGEVVPLVDVETNEYKSKEPDGFINFILGLIFFDNLSNFFLVLG